MNSLLAILAGCVAVLAATRSTWSPCGLSMLSTITPLAEKGRRHRYAATASWFFTGNLSGGACLGAACAALAAAYGAIGVPHLVTAAVAATAALVCAASESTVTGLGLPVHRRQVNERWLDSYRPWVYGFGFGWQTGFGLATYIATSAVYLMILLGVLSASPLSAFVAGVLFGLVRGLSVLLGRSVRSPEALRGLHRQLSRIDPVSRQVAAWSQLAVFVLLVGSASVAASVAAAGAAGVFVLLAYAGTSLRPRQSSSESACSGQLSTASAASFSRPSGTSSTSSTQCPKSSESKTSGASA